jgi:heme/copper-type cytochrome/quinol oxidase subunit 3
VDPTTLPADLGRAWSRWAVDPGNTAVLLAVGSAYVAGLVRVRRLGRPHPSGRVVSFAAGWLLLGMAFLGLQIYDYTELPFEVSSHAYGTMYYAMTGLHGLHVLAGLILMLVVLGRASQGVYATGRIDGLHAVGYYWHFVDVVWIGLFATLFLVR